MVPVPSPTNVYATGLSSDGNRLALSCAGTLRILENSGGTYSQVYSVAVTGGTYMFMSGDGLTTATSAGGTGLQIHYRTSGTWALQATIIACVSYPKLSTDGNTLVWNCMGEGVVLKHYVATRTGTTWSAATLLYTGVSDAYGFITIAKTTKDIIVLCNGSGFITYQLSGGTWSQLGSTVTFAGMMFGIDTNSDGTRLVVSREASNTIYFYTRSGSTWTLVTSASQSGRFGLEVRMSLDGRIIHASAQRYAADTGATFVYRCNDDCTQLIQQSGPLVYSNMLTQPDISISEDGTTFAAPAFALPGAIIFR